jgi:hypothetical protein
MPQEEAEYRIADWKRNISTFSGSEDRKLFHFRPLLPSECRRHANQELDAPFVFWNYSSFVACDTLRSNPSMSESTGNSLLMIERLLSLISRFSLAI